MSIFIYSSDTIEKRIVDGYSYNSYYGIADLRSVNVDPGKYDQIEWDRNDAIFLNIDISNNVVINKALKAELVFKCLQSNDVKYSLYETEEYSDFDIADAASEIGKTIPPIDTYISKSIHPEPNSSKFWTGDQTDKLEEIRFDITSHLNEQLALGKKSLNIRLSNNSDQNCYTADPKSYENYTIIVMDSRTDINHTVNFDKNNKNIIDLESGKLSHLVTNDMVHTFITNDNVKSNTNVVTGFNYYVECRSFPDCIVITNWANEESIYHHIDFETAKESYGFDDERTGKDLYLNIADMSFIIDFKISGNNLKVYNPDGTILELYKGNPVNGIFLCKLTRMSQHNSFININWINPSEVICTNEENFTQKIHFTGERIDKIEYPEFNREFRFNYFLQGGNDYLNSIEEYLIDELDNRLAGKYEFTYYTADMFLKSVTHPDGITTISYEYENGKVKKVVKDSGLTSFEEFTYVPDNNYTKIKNQFNKEYSVYYNDSKQKVMTSFEDGYITYESILSFEGKYLKQRKEVASSNENLISNVNLSTWSGYSSSEGDTSIPNNLFPDAIGTNIIMMKGEENLERSITNTILLNEANEGDELFFSIWGKTKFSLTSQFYIEVSTDGSSRLHTFSFNKAESGWQILSGTIIAENNYSSVTFTIKNKGNIDVYLGKPMLNMKSKEAEYEYNNNSQIQGISLGTNQLEFEYDKEKLVRAATPSGRIINYTYDTEGNIHTIKDECSLFKIENVYLNRNLVKQIKTTIDGKISEVLNSYNEKNELIRSVDESGLPVDYVYDKFGRVVELQDSSGIVYNTVYDTGGKVTETNNHINDIFDGGSFDYGSNDILYGLKTKNGTEYEFNYNSMNMLSNAGVDREYLEFRKYEKEINNYNTGLMTEKQYGKGVNNKFQFGYDDKLRLLTKKNNLTDMVTIAYDDENNEVSISDHVNQISKVIDYDSEGRTTKETITDSNQDIVENLYSYDNLGGLQKRSYKSDKSGYTDRSYDFDYAYEFQEYSLDGYFDRVSNAYLNDYLRPNYAGNTIHSKIKNKVGGQYVFEDAPSLKLFDIEFNYELNQNVMRFNDIEGSLVFTNGKLNSKRVDGKYYGSHQFSETNWDNAFEDDKIIYSWIKVTGQVTTSQEIMRLGGLSLNINSDKILTLDDNRATILTDLPIFFDEWTLVGLRVEKNDQANHSATVFVNGMHSMHDVSQDASCVDVLSIGSYPSSNPTQTYLDSKVLVQTECVVDVLYIGYGTNNISNENLTKIYKDGKFYIDIEPNHNKEQVSYYNHLIYSGSEVITLNGSYVSSCGNKPKSYSFTDGNHKLKKTKLFKYDHKLQKHTFGSFSNYNNYDTVKDSKLSYDLEISSTGSINVFVKPSSEYKSEKRTILAFVNGAASMLDLFIDEHYVLKYIINGTEYNSNLKLNFDEWNMVTMLWQSNKLQLSLNNSELKTKTTCPIMLSGTSLFIGSRAMDDTPLDHFEGELQMLSIWNTNLTVQQISDLYNDGLQLSVQTEFDHNGRMSSKNIISNGNILTKKYQYFDEKYIEYDEEKQKFNPLPTSEIDIDGNEVVYTYDEYLNVTKKQTIDDASQLISITRYEYDNLKRLAKETLNSVEIYESPSQFHDYIEKENFEYSFEYKYDSNGNILEKTSVDGDNQIIFKDTYHYSATCKDRLERISRMENSAEVDIYNFAYSSDDEFRPTTIIKDGQSSTLSWNGPRLMQYGTTQYAYNESGLRIKKSGTGVNVNYNLDGSMIIQSIDTINSKTIDYHFDQNEQVIGFRFDGKEFLYQRNILGEIYGIIDISGKQFVKYEYTAFGVPTISLGTGLTANETTIAQSISEQNIYLYKGYVYDQETGLYYCQTRYYNPNIGRWISIDTISYLDPESINGLNLYAYCGNNPVMYSDISGCAPEWARVLVGVIVIAAAIAICVLTAGTAAPVLWGLTIGAGVSGAWNLGSQLYSNGGDWNSVDYSSVGWSMFGGAVAGAVAAIPIGGSGFFSYLGTFALGGTGSTAGGFVSGSVDSWSDAGLAFVIGGTANVVARGISDKIVNAEADKIVSMSANGQKRIVQQLAGHTRNQGASALKNSIVNEFKHHSKDQIVKLIVRSSDWWYYGIQAAFVSSTLSGWY